jgi:predicted nucleic acid-binding protein
MPIISVVTYGEILSFGMQKNWGDKKLQDISTLLSKLIIVDVNSGDPDMLKAYAEIDAFSKGRLPGHPLGTSAITMGKNDLWIAATAKVANATLITVDSDFNHLNNNFIRVKKY